MAIRRLILCAALLAPAVLAGCKEKETGPVAISAIGAAPRLANPNLEPLDPSSALYLGAVAQGLVRFDATGQIEPALAQSWIVSDDGLRYTFRLMRTDWTGGGRVTAQQVVARLRAAASRASRNPLKPVLGAIEEIEAMTDEVLEISLRAPRPNLLQMLAQPEMAIVRNGRGTGPFHALPGAGGAVALHLEREEEEEEPQAEESIEPDLLLRGEPAALAVARFRAGGADLVTGGTIGNLPIVRAAQPGDGALVFDPAAGLFGLAFTDRAGLLENPAVRRALSMALDREAMVAAFAVPDLQPRTSILPELDELPAPALPDWAQSPMPMRRQLAAAAVAGAADEPLTLRVAVPEGPGYRLLFAYLRRDWRLIGVDAEMVAMNAPADLRLIDSVAPIASASWYLRHFTCDASPICVEEAAAMLDGARAAPTPANRSALLAQADRAMTDATLFIPIAAPVRWSLVAPRLGTFRTNILGIHPALALIEVRQ